MRYLLILSIVISSAIAIVSCSAGEFTHLSAKEEVKVVFGDGSDDLGVEGYMPTIGKIYIDSVTVGDDDGGEEKMLKAHLTYLLSADIIVDNYTNIDGGQCEWTAGSNDVKFIVTGGTTSRVTTTKTALTYDETYGTYNCAQVQVEMKKTGEEINYDPDSLVTVSYIRTNGEYVTAVASDVKFSARINLNTADRHNIISVATSPTTVLFHRKDGLFQAGYTAYRGILGLNDDIGSAMYEARVKAPGATNTVDPNVTYSQVYNEARFNADNATITNWLNNVSDNGIYSESAFVASYGPPIMLPDFTSGAVRPNYNKLRVALLRHNNYPIIVSHDKKMYTMGAITNFNSLDLTQNYPYFIRQNDNWFAYSGVNVANTSGKFYNTLHVGEIKPNNGVDAKFVSVVAITSDLDTTFALNEVDKEYYIAGNPHWNHSFCGSSATFDETTTGFTYNYQCYYAGGRNIGARKIVGLQAKIGDGATAIGSDNEIFFIGRDGKGYKIDIRPDGINGDNIRNGLPVVSELVTWNDKLPAEEQVSQEVADSIYVKDMAYANMNHAVTPTLLLSDGSIVFTIRTAVNNGDNVTIGNQARRFFINTQGTISAVAGSPYNIRMIKLLGPTSAYGEDGNIYYFTDVPALGVSYAPVNEYYASQSGWQNVSGDFGDPLVDEDYLAFVYGDPIQFFDLVDNNEKQNFFRLTYGKIDIDESIKKINSKPATSYQLLGNNFAFLPYNPLTGQVENFLRNSDNSISLQAVAYRPFRTNSHLFVNMNKDADKSYISVPHYFYGYNWSGNAKPSEWSYRKNGLMAAEVKHGNISKVFGALKSPEIPFRYTPYGRNTTFFANKVGIFSFVDYNVRRTTSVCSDNNGKYECNLNTGNSSTNGGSLSTTNSLSSIVIDNSTKFPDYFYIGKSTNAWIDGESSGVNNYISTPLVKESRMANYPDTRKFKENGFEPQLLSSWFSYEFEEVPSTSATYYSGFEDLPGYLISYWYNIFKPRFAGDQNQTNYFKSDIDTFLSYTSSNEQRKLYQYAYGVGEYRYYEAASFPVWRARKLNTEILPYQTRYGTLVPLSHGKTVGELAPFLMPMFYFTDFIANSGEIDTASFVSKRKYLTGLYGFYDQSQIMSATGDLGANVFGSISDPMSKDQIVGNKIGYVADKGVYMWRNTPVTQSAISEADANTFRDKFSAFVNYAQ